MQSAMRREKATKLPHDLRDRELSKRNVFVEPSEDEVASSELIETWLRPRRVIRKQKRVLEKAIVVHYSNPSSSLKFLSATPTYIVAKRTFELGESEAASAFIQKTKLEDAINAAVDIVEETFSKIQRVRFELDEGDEVGDEHVRIFVTSTMSSGKAKAYEKFYEIMAQRIVRQNWRYIGLSF